MKFDVLTLFPEMFEPIKQSIIGKAKEKGLNCDKTITARGLKRK